MRPASIVMFERFFLASLALSVISVVLGYGAMMDELGREPALAQMGIGGGLVIGVVALGLVINLLLWFLIARKASNAAKWILVILTALGLASSLPSALGGPWNLMTILGLASYALEIAAIVYLFKDDAKAWLKGEWNADPATFD